MHKEGTLSNKNNAALFVDSKTFIPLKNCDTLNRLKIKTMPCVMNTALVNSIRYASSRWVIYNSQKLYLQSKNFIIFFCYLLPYASRWRRPSRPWVDVAVVPPGDINIDPALE